jgi:hypothetical protein
MIHYIYFYKHYNIIDTKSDISIINSNWNKNWGLSAVTQTAIDSLNNKQQTAITSLAVNG